MIFKKKCLECGKEFETPYAKKKYHLECSIIVHDRQSQRRRGLLDMVSNCCGAAILGENDGYGTCSACKEHCVAEEYVQDN